MARKIIDSVVINNVLSSEEIEALRYKYDGDEVDDLKPVTIFPKYVTDEAPCKLTYLVRNRYLNYMRYSKNEKGVFSFNNKDFETPKPIMCFMKALVLEHVSFSKEYSDACLAAFMLLIQKLPSQKFDGYLTLPGDQSLSLVESSIFDELADLYREVVQDIDKS